MGGVVWLCTVNEWKRHKELSFNCNKKTFCRGDVTHIHAGRATAHAAMRRGAGPAPTRTAPMATARSERDNMAGQGSWKSTGSKEKMPENAEKRQGIAFKNWVSQSYDKLLSPKLHDGWCAGGWDAERGGRWRCARRTPCAASQHVVVKRGGDD
jgi:hypothetical protein